MEGMLYLTLLFVVTLLYLLAFSVTDWDERLLVRLTAYVVCVVCGFFATDILTYAFAGVYLILLSATITAQILDRQLHDGA